ncbi:MAG: permease [Candidatus Margulisiibacteriota bacterium]
MYGSCAAILPIAIVLFQKGLSLGTVLAFLMAVSALSLPEAIILRRQMTTKLILIFFGVVTAGIIFIGYLFNYISPAVITNNVSKIEVNPTCPCLRVPGAQPYSSGSGQ